MKRLLTLTVLLTLAGALMAMGFWPQTTLVEIVTDDASAAHADAYQGMMAAEDAFNRNELAQVCYFNGAYGTPDVTGMINLLGITEYPTAVFGRMATVAGGGEDVISGAAYIEQIDDTYFSASPVGVQIASFDATSGDWAVDFTMYDSDLLLIDVPVQIVMFEDFVDNNVNHVARQVHQGTLTLGGPGSTESLNGSFDVSGYDTANLHLLAVICNGDGGYLNAATTLHYTAADLQPAVPFDLHVVGPSWQDEGNYQYDGDFFGLVNMGEGGNFAADLGSVGVPDGMSLMYCYEDSHGGSGCFNPAGGPFSFSLAHGDWIMFHLLIPQVTQACTFEYSFTFVPESSSRPVPLEIPFTFTTEELGVADGDVPAVATLHQNQPNPFNPSTSISFSLAQTQDVRLTVYDVRGRKVRTLAAQAMQPGQHTVVWDGADDTGSTVGSGLYFYRLQAGESSQTRRMLLLK